MLCLCFVLVLVLVHACACACACVPLRLSFSSKVSSSDPRSCNPLYCIYAEVDSAMPIIITRPVSVQQECENAKTCHFNKSEDSMPRGDLQQWIGVLSPSRQLERL